MHSIEKVLYLDTATAEKFIHIWETSLKAAIPAFPQQTLNTMKPELEEHLRGIRDLACVKNSIGTLLAASAIRDQKLELFCVSAQATGNGIGRLLLTYAISAQKAKYIDILEDNMQAIGFFEHFGFQIYNRCESNLFGTMLPIVQMKLNG